MKEKVIKMKFAPLGLSNGRCTAEFGFGLIFWYFGLLNSVELASCDELSHSGHIRICMSHLLRGGFDFGSAYLERNAGKT